MEKVTYLIGAGASYYSLPLVKTMSERMTAFSRFLKIQNEKSVFQTDFSTIFIKELDELINISKQRTSIDAYARELSISNLPNSKIKLIRLKALLSSYLIFEQLIKPEDLVFFSEKLDFSSIPADYFPYNNEIQEMLRCNIDKRYITFWGEYLDEQNDIPKENLKILSWNYDMQFEAAYSQIKGFSLGLTQERLQIFPSTLTEIDNSKFCILKLNGTAGLLKDRENYINSFDLSEDTLTDSVNYLIKILEKNYDRALNSPLFSFAWEKNNPIVEKTRQLASRIIKDTTILVVIGYSFPRFNRTVDREIFKEISQLKKIYYQVPKDESQELIDKLDGINIEMKAKAIPKYNLDTFYIPNET